MTDPILRQQFLNGMSRAAATVNVVTTDGAAGKSGVTVSAMSSVSADAEAPVILVCLHHLGKAAQTTIDNGAFVVNVLREDQSFISDTFAGRRETDDGDHFSCVEWTEMSTGCPRVVDPLVAFDCKILSSERVGTHYVVLGSVQEIFVAASGKPLIFADRSYGSAEQLHQFHAEEKRPENALRVGVLSNFGPRVFPKLIQEMEAQYGKVVVDLYEGHQRKISELLHAGDIDIALMYDIDLSDSLQIATLESHQPYAVLPASHPLAENSVLSLQVLSEHPLVLLDSPPARKYLLSLFDQADVRANVAYRPWGPGMVHGMVDAGLGYCIQLSGGSNELPKDNSTTVFKSLSDELPTIDMVAACNSDSLPPLAQQFWDTCLRFYQ